MERGLLVHKHLNPVIERGHSVEAKEGLGNARKGLNELRLDGEQKFSHLNKPRDHIIRERALAVRQHQQSRHSLLKTSFAGLLEHVKLVAHFRDLEPFVCIHRFDDRTFWESAARSTFPKFALFCVLPGPCCNSDPK